MQANGVNYCIKHFAMNDQESGRESLNTFATEQTVREAYLRAFEGAFVEGGAQSTMTAFNRRCLLRRQPAVAEQRPAR